MVIDSKQEAPTSADNGRKISPEELAQHATAKDCWLLIDGIVYDVTKYLDNHPGGSAVMVEHAGQDCTSNFEDIGMRVVDHIIRNASHFERCPSWFSLYSALPRIFSHQPIQPPSLPGNII
jgi:hypothetical protein